MEHQHKTVGGSSTTQNGEDNGPQNGLANFLFYCALPTSLIAAIIFRYNFIGVIYLILLICWPFCHLGFSIFFIFENIAISRTNSNETYRVKK